MIGRRRHRDASSRAFAKLLLVRAVGVARVVLLPSAMEGFMLDVLFLAIVAVFFAVSLAYVAGCDRL